MNDIFISNIHINEVRHLKNMDISLSNDKRQHLILTGKNGSGKTSLLEQLKGQCANGIQNGGFQLISTLKQQLLNYEKGIQGFHAALVNTNEVESMPIKNQIKQYQDGIN